MTVAFTARFLRAFDELTTQEQTAVERAVDRAQEDWRHPGLRAKKIQGTQDIWELRASRELRLTFEVRRGRLVFRMCGHHDAVLHQP